MKRQGHLFEKIIDIDNIKLAIHNASKKKKKRPAVQRVLADIDGVMFGNNKRKLHKARKEIEKYLASIGLSMKGNWQVFKTDSRPLDFLGYRFYRTHTTLRRRNAIRIRRRVKKAARKPFITYKDASAILSYLGWIYHSNSYGYMTRHILPYVKIKKLKEVVRIESRKQHHAATSLCH